MLTVRTKVCLLNPQPPFILCGRDYSSCPQADLYVAAGIVWKRSFEPALGVSQSAASDKIAKLGLQEIEIDRLSGGCKTRAVG